MSQKVKEKIEKALLEGQKRREEMANGFKCPLRCWDIFAMLREDYKKKDLK
ncbi:MAG: hypothetical protein MUE85_22450 [Microscillaceae bacterium]|jgi:hypothetical protein|nr:hypothetical protein [Microscillaceae bacterium]